jgi:hypothetical protein
MKNSKKSKSTIPRKENVHLFGESSTSIPNTLPYQSPGFFFGGSSSSNTQPAGFSFGASSTPWDPRFRFTQEAVEPGFPFGANSSSRDSHGFSFGGSSVSIEINNILKKSFDLFKQGRITHFPDMKEFIHYIQNVYYFYPDIISKNEIGKLYWMFKLTHLSEIEKIYSIARSDSPDRMYQDWNEWPESWHRGNRLEGLD